MLHGSRTYWDRGCMGVLLILSESVVAPKTSLKSKTGYVDLISNSRHPVGAAGYTVASYMIILFETRVGHTEM